MTTATEKKRVCPGSVAEFARWWCECCSLRWKGSDLGSFRGNLEATTTEKMCVLGRWQSLQDDGVIVALRNENSDLSSFGGKNRGHCNYVNELCLGCVWQGLQDGGVSGMERL